MKTTTVIITQSPLGTVRVAEALRMSVGLTLCNDAVQVLFTDDGVYTLLDTSPGNVKMPAYARHLKTLEQLKQRLFADRESLHERGIETVAGSVAIVSRAEAVRMLLPSDCVIRY
jgi:sulfur relay (sulfurtransferase) DsrF/TusC family protein